MGPPASIQLQLLLGCICFVTVTSVITDPSVIPASINLQKLDAGGRVVAVPGTLHDDGLDGDAVAGDKIYSITTTVLESNTGTVKYRVSAGFLGELVAGFLAGGKR
ncbi:MAG: hypothetical protein IPP36_06855 [Nitrosomonadales bacterium]|nr:hypothetical protein [Nitrosomonadales bacterium]